MGPESDAARRELLVQPVDGALQVGTRDRQLQIAKAQVQQLLVGQRLPRSAPPGGRSAGVLFCQVSATWLKDILASLGVFLPSLSKILPSIYVPDLASRRGSL